MEIHKKSSSYYKQTNINKNEYDQHMWHMDTAVIHSVMQWAKVRKTQTSGVNWKQSAAIDFCLWSSGCGVRLETGISPTHVFLASACAVSWQNWRAWSFSAQSHCAATSFLTCTSSEIPSTVSTYHTACQTHGQGFDSWTGCYPVASIPPNLQSKSSATPPVLGTGSPNFWLKFSPPFLGFFPSSKKISLRA